MAGSSLLCTCSFGHCLTTPLTEKVTKGRGYVFFLLYIFSAGSKAWHAVDNNNNNF